MQNRFGLKDFVLYLLVVLAIVVVVLNSRQSDRFWRRNAEAMDRLKTVESQIARVASSLETVSSKLTQVSDTLADGVSINQQQSASPSAGEPKPAGSTGARDTSWARPGVEIQWQPEVAMATDPRGVEGFREGGEVTEIWEAQTKTLTPAISTDVYSRRVQELVLESLADLDPVTLKMEGRLAEAWQIDPEGMWLRARLRPNARFSDGTPVTSEDIRWSFHDYVMNEQIDAERSRSILRDSIVKVEPLDARTVEFTFKEPLFTNVDNALGLSVLPKHIYSQVPPSQINQSTGLLVGSGPYKLKDFSIQNQWAYPDDIVLERNEQYWGPRPALGSLRYKAINEEIGRLNAFYAGDAEIITPSAPQFVSKQEDPAWRERAEFLKWTNMRSGYSFIAWNCGERKGRLTPFHDRRVRLAMTHALDRWKMINDIWKGIGDVAKGNQPLGGPASNPAIEPWPYSPAEAIRLLKEAGWEDRDGNGVLEDKLGNEFSFEFTFSGGGEIADRIANFVKDSYETIGIRVVKRPVEWSVYTDLLKTRDFDAITLGWGASAPESDPIQIFHSKSIQNQGDNFAQWANPRADQLIDSGRRTMDDAARAKIWQELEAVLHEEQPYTFVRVPPWTRLVSKQVGNVVPYPKGLEPAEYFRYRTSAPSPGF